MYNNKLNYLSDAVDCPLMPLLYYPTFSFYDFNVHVSHLKINGVYIEAIIYWRREPNPAELIYKSRNNRAGF